MLPEYLCEAALVQCRTNLVGCEEALRARGVEFEGSEASMSEDSHSFINQHQRSWKATPLLVPGAEAPLLEP